MTTNSPTGRDKAVPCLYKTTFVNLKSELTHDKELSEFCALDVYRTRLKCNCKAEFNRRDGILIVDSTGQIVEKVIRCKSCAGGVETGHCPVSTNANQEGGQI